LLALWKEWGLDTILRKAWDQGILLAGLSAGSLCWFDEGITDSFGDELDLIQGLGFLQGSHCPHYDGELERRPSYHKFISSQDVQPGIAADDGVAIHYKEQEISKIVSSRPEAKAYRVSLGGQVIESVLQPQFLGIQ